MLSPEERLDIGDVIELPIDSALGGVVEALDPQNVLSACREQFASVAHDERSSWKHCRVVEALYHPGRYVRVAYALLADADIPVKRNWPEGQIVYLHAPLRPPMSRRGRVLRLGGRPVEAYLFPNDRRLRGLRKFTSRQDAADLWRNWIRESGDDFEMSAESLRRVLIRYVPEQKWIVRLRVRGVDRPSGGPAKRSIAVRCASKRSCGILAGRHRVLTEMDKWRAAPFRIPRVVGLQMTGGLLATEWIRGRTLLEWLGSQPAHAVMEKVAGVLHSFHTQPEEMFTSLPDADVMSRVTEAVADLSLSCPKLEKVLHKIECEFQQLLGGLSPCRPAILHNDFHWNQLRVNDQHCTILDLERMCVGDPMIDAANFSTQLRMLAYRAEHVVSHEQATAWAEAFLDAWSRRTETGIESVRFACYSTLSRLELARGMMRHLRPGWRTLVEPCIELSDRSLSNATGRVGIT